MPQNQSKPADSSGLLHGLLDANLQFPPEYRDQLTNHLPMALHALQSLGASPQRMQDFYATYTRRFEGLDLPARVSAPGSPTFDWRVLRGQPDAYPALLAYFNQQVVQGGRDATLRRALPELLPGVAAAAFHGLIRAAHAADVGHAGELAAALAYWAWRWQPLAAPANVGALLGLEDWAARLVRDAVGWHSDKGLISIRMDEASRSPVYLDLAGALAPAESLGMRIAELAAWAVGRYAASPNFTVLHMITGLHAFRTLLPWLEGSDAVQPAVQRVLANNVTAAYLAAGVAPPEALAGGLPEPSPPGWTQVVAAAIASDDEHVIKLVHACRQEAAVYGQGQYLRAAAQAVSA